MNISDYQVWRLKQNNNRNLRGYPGKVEQKNGSKNLTNNSVTHFPQVPSCFMIGMKSGDMCVTDDRTKAIVKHPRLSDYCIDCMKFHKQDSNYVTFSNWNGHVSFTFSF